MSNEGLPEDSAPETSIKSCGTASTSFSTPPKAFLEELFEDSVHSPPHKDNEVPQMSKEEAEKRMQALIAYPLSWLSSERYQKLAWVVGVGMDVYIENAYGVLKRAIVEFMLSENHPIGKRFSAVYNAEGDETSEAREGESVFDNIVGNIHQDWTGTNNDTSFTFFGSKSHPNVEMFHKYQACGGCFVHGPLLAHWYKSQWQNPETSANDIEFIHVSKFARNALSGKQLFDLIFRDSGGDHELVAREVCPTCAVVRLSKSKMTFDAIQVVMDQNGPLMVALDMHDDLSNEKLLSHRGGSLLDKERKANCSHVMVAVGVRKESQQSFPKDLKDRCGRDEKLDAAKLERLSTILLLQNFWEEKEFLEIDLQYLQEVEGHLHHMEGKIDVTANAYKATREPANLIRRAYCSSPVDRPSSRRLYY